MRHLSFLKRRIRNFLYVPGREWLLGYIATVYTMIRKKKFVHVFFDNGTWIHQYAEGTVTDRHINYSLSLKQYIRDARDYWTFVYQPKLGDMIIDIGAGKGEDVPFFSHAVGPMGRVIAIEAHPKTFRCLSKLCQYNNLMNVTPVCAAICDKEGEITIDNPDSDIMSSVTNAMDGFRVQSYTLDNIIAMHNIDTIDFIKMNIEGAEKMAIHGMNESIKKIRYMCISCHDFLADERHDETLRTKNGVKKFFTDNGFRVITRDADTRPYIRDQVHIVNERLVRR